MEILPSQDEKKARDKEITVPVEMAKVLRTLVNRLPVVEKRISTLSLIFSRLKEKLSTRQGKRVWSKTTLHKYMQQNGFTFQSEESYYDHLKEREDVQEQRQLHWVGEEVP